VSDPRTLFVCGECAARLLERGGTVAHGVTKIEQGHMCDVHAPGTFAPYATNAIAWVGPLDPVPSTLPPFPPAPSTLPAVPEGTVTELAARLLVAWSADSNGATADDVMIQRAVDVAKRLLVVTEGA
jgi:hypothetical protein